MRNHQTLKHYAPGKHKTRIQTSGLAVSYQRSVGGFQERRTMPVGSGSKSGVTNGVGREG
jgi:hypothetical protein